MLLLVGSQRIKSSVVMLYQKLGWHRALFLSVLLLFHSWQTLCPQTNQTVPSTLRAYRADTGAMSFSQEHSILFQHSSSSCQLPGLAQPGKDRSWPRLPRSIQAEQEKDVTLEVSSAEGRFGSLSFPGFTNPRTTTGPCIDCLQSPWC